jgi:hypothetical protein
MFRTIHAPRRVLQIGVAAFVGVAAFSFATASTAQTGDESQAVAPASESPSSASPRMDSAPTAGVLDSGFRNLYELDFKGGREKFVYYQKLEPNDPMGKAAEAASYLYEQFNQKGIFTSEFFLSDDKFLGGAIGSPSENRNDLFLNANHAAREMATTQLKADPANREALLVLTMADGMEADYDALLIKKQMAGLGLTKQADAEAVKLLAVDPNAEDAYMALGAANYVIGCLPSYKRAFLWFGGIHGDRLKGMQQLQRAAENGHYMKGFAKAWLALAYEREHQPDQARRLLQELAAEYPANPIYAKELALLDHPAEKR